MVHEFWETSSIKEKKCIICNEDKPYSEFAKHPTTFDGHDGRCNECRKRKIKEVRELRKTAPPMTERCECCGKTPESAYAHHKKQKLCLDHNPLTKKFRGWLCKECNMAIGMLGDTIEGVQKAIEYLKDR